MKNMKNFHFAILAVSLIFISSCGKQLYSYRDKVSVKKETAIVKSNPKNKIIESKKAEIKIEKSKASEPLIAGIEQNNPSETKKIENSIKETVPSSGSKSSFKSLSNEVKDIKKQFKALHKELKKQDLKENQALVNNPIKWMVVGLILIIVGAILGMIVGAGGFISWIGSLIFLVGLLFWLLELI
jgi:ABC-type multidrug transport system fused ATPase/permease subunit